MAALAAFFFFFFTVGINQSDNVFKIGLLDWGSLKGNKMGKSRTLGGVSSLENCAILVQYVHGQISSLPEKGAAFKPTCWEVGSRNPVSTDWFPELQQADQVQGMNPTYVKLTDEQEAHFRQKT